MVSATIGGWYLLTAELADRVGQRRRQEVPGIAARWLVLNYILLGGRTTRVNNLPSVRRYNEMNGSESNTRPLRRDTITSQYHIVPYTLHFV